MTNANEIQTDDLQRNNTQKFLLEIGFELLEICYESTHKTRA